MRVDIPVSAFNVYPALRMIPAVRMSALHSNTSFPRAVEWPFLRRQDPAQVPAGLQPHGQSSRHPGKYQVVTNLLLPLP
jgi:hypothetical protein